MIHRSPLPDVQIPDTSLTDHVLERAGELDAKPALIDGPTGRTLTYRQLEHDIRGLATGLIENGFGKGDVLAVVSPNLPEYAVAFHAAALAGGTVTTINPAYTAREVHDQLIDAGASILVVAPAFEPVASQAA